MANEDLKGYKAYTVILTVTLIFSMLWLQYFTEYTIFRKTRTVKDTIYMQSSGKWYKVDKSTSYNIKDGETIVEEAK